VPVVAFLVGAHKDLQDFEAGLKLAEGLMKIIPEAKCDLSALRGEAQKTEDALRKIQAHAAAPDIYR
jgi:predicted ATP-grasp superfamily ATP-dependent carboligase